MDQLVETIEVAHP